jgi:hypothetical protein
MLHVSQGNHFGDSVCYDGDDYPANRSEFEVYNKQTVNDPIVLTADELARLGQQLIDLADVQGKVAH